LDRKAKEALRPLGARVRDLRQELGWTQKELAERSSVSLRFLVDLEAGRGNISIGRLLGVAEALGAPIAALVAPLDEAVRRGRTVALVGLRGAGKTTIGLALARTLGLELVELDHAIERAAGLGLAQIFEIHGEDYYRRLELEQLGALLDPRGRRRVLATGGGLVTHKEAWLLLRRRARTVWLKARPEEHYRRVMAQGDLRPIENRPAAMAELRSILELRAPHYAEAELALDTSALGVVGAVDAIQRWLGA
jgi:XRE family aerobic/anaerobic benzoate catabolism transcriptional regulator